VYLQIYNINTSEWDTIDEIPLTFGSSVSEFGGEHEPFGTEEADVDFYLTASVPDLTDYKDGNNVISVRVYQLDV